MKFTAQVLNETEQVQVHEESLRILSEVGVKFLGEKAIPLLKKNGARVDDATRTARLPPQMVAEALEAAPKAFTLGARNPAYAYPLPSPRTRYCIDGTAAFALDFVSGEKRYGVLQDIQDSLRIFQQMDMGVMAWAPTTASDTPAGVRALHEFFAVMKYSSKHGQHELHFTNQVPFLLAGLQAVLGTEAEIKARKDYSLIYCPVAPLMHDGAMLDAYLALGQVEMPVMIMPMPVPGTTGPASLFANICLANAEALSAIVVYELANLGRPHRGCQAARAGSGPRKNDDHPASGLHGSGPHRRFRGDRKRPAPDPGADRRRQRAGPLLRTDALRGGHEPGQRLV